MNEELYQLCKEVYKRNPFWAGTDMIYGKEDGHNWRIMPLTFRVPKRNRIPLYTSDYLMEKLPESIDAGRSFAVDMFLVLDRPKSLMYRYRAFYTAPSYGKIHEVISETPLKALLKLVLALHDAGVKL